MWSKIASFFGFGSSAPKASPSPGEESIPDSLPSLTPLQEQTRKQMEFYLSDSNVARDVFMKNLINAREDRYCPIETFLRFNRLKTLGATADDIAIACQASLALEVDETKQFVRTRVPFKLDPRRLYRMIRVSGLEKDETLETLQEVFGAEFGDVPLIKLIMKGVAGGEKVFSGVAEVELGSEEVAQQAVANGVRYRDRIVKAEILANVREGLRGSAAKEKRQKNGQRSPRQGRR
jgi:hypothetical protein